MDNNQNLINDENNTQTQNIPKNNATYQASYNPQNKNPIILIAKYLFILSIISLIIVLIIFGKDLIFKDKHQVSNSKEIAVGQTAVISNNIYKDAILDSREDAVELITLDSDAQKEKCDDEEIKKIERRLEVKHKIIAVNLCEMDLDFAKELEKTVDKVFSDFPTIKGYLTNMTLTNPKEDTTYIAAFTATQLFATSNSVDTYPHAYKMIMNLNTAYFLEPQFLESSVEEAKSIGYFPAKASRSSVVAHEFGHYISFVALLRSTFLDDTLLLTKYNYQRYLDLVNSWNKGEFSQKIIKEAYTNYKKKYNDNSTTELQFRESISGYAVATDANGNYIYDETIAEAFHDNYLNGNQAKPASKEIIKVLRKYMNGYVEK